MVSIEDELNWRQPEYILYIVKMDFKKSKIIEFSMEGLTPPPHPHKPLLWKIINFPLTIFSNKVRVIRDILQSNKSARDLQCFEGKSRFVMYGGDFDFFMFQTI